MGGASQPYMYTAQRQSHGRFPEKPFDPKAITRQSWEPKPSKPKPNGPLVSFNRHPDAHMVLEYRSKQYPSLGPRTKSCIKWLRRLQLLLRLIQLNAALGIVALMVLLTHVEPITHWVLRIAPGVVALFNAYAVFHFSRDAAGRTPASTAAYQVFAAVSDVVVLGLYAFGAFITHRDSGTWGALIDPPDHPEILGTLTPVLYYTFVGAGGLHFISLAISIWLGWAFRQITLLPPDMNPLEDNLTARPLHKRNKSSVASFSTYGTEKRDSIIGGSPRKSGVPSEASQHQFTVPFSHTRTQSRDSFASRESQQLNLPSRQYQIMPGNSARNSVASLESNRMSAYGAHRGSYAEVPTDDPTASLHASSPRDSQQRVGKFTETWKPTDSLISRTNQKNREIAAAKAGHRARASKSYAALNQRYNMDDMSDSEDEKENNGQRTDGENAPYGSMHPNPLRSHPADLKRASVPRMKTPFYPAANSLGEINNNQRRVSASRDIADQHSNMVAHGYVNARHTVHVDDYVYSRPYGDLKPATPPVLVGNNRKVSSGNDYDLGSSSRAYERRNVSGKIMEEGRSGDRGSRYGLPDVRR
ncbi:hypothetical protein B0I35DRAFT_415927 [Stachybotrys elegans]|uniref:Uncharacterized protein n=1 Tax=Stachybotrys elegans TaxID=80388 RepID=A0A8K0WVQ9_9HYPO|nr:hypothetical protein B0I35DRAFT_415927 [Stachybotrys elegans]